MILVLCSDLVLSVSDQWLIDLYVIVWVPGKGWTMESMLDIEVIVINMQDFVCGPPMTI